MSKRRVVITGLGIVSSLGLGHEELWDALLKSKSGISHIKGFDASKHDTNFAAEITNFKPDKWLDRKEAKRIDLFAQYGIASAAMSSP